MVDGDVNAQLERAPARALAIFLLLLCAFSAVAYALTIHLHRQTPMLSRFMMWCPGAAALGTCAILRLPQAALGWRWPKGRWLAFAYVAPILYALPVYGLTWAIARGALAPGSFLGATAAEYGFPGSPVLATMFIGLPLMATAGMVGGMTWALGEELGWRGFLLPRLSERWGFTSACLASGLVWAVWHYPVLIWADYNAGTEPALAILFFTCSVIGMSFILGWLRLRTDSVWPCVLLHASHNTFIQGVFDPMTADIGGSRLATTEFGFGLALTICAAAAMLLARYPVAPRGRPSTQTA